MSTTMIRHQIAMLRKASLPPGDIDLAGIRHSSTRAIEPPATALLRQKVTSFHRPRAAFSGSATRLHVALKHLVDRVGMS